MTLSQMSPKIQHHIFKRTSEITHDYIRHIEDLCTLYNIPIKEYFKELPAIVQAAVMTELVLRSSDPAKEIHALLDSYDITAEDLIKFMKNTEGFNNE